MGNSFILRVIIITVFLVSGALAFDGNLGLKDLRLSGYCYWQFGQIVKGDKTGDPTQENPIDHQWTNSALLGLTVSTRPCERLQVVLSPEFRLNYTFPEIENSPQTVRPFGVAYINEADGILSIGSDPQKPVLDLALGVFTYKYDPDARHLGEFLFRTGTYPMYIITDFDFPKSRLVGMKLTSDAITNFHADLLLTSEAFIYPLYDFSLTGIASYKLLNAIDIGGGVDFARLMPVVPSKTSPKIPQSLRPGYNEYIKANGDTDYYSFKGTKLMARASIDIKAFFGSPEIFGKEDLKLYGEFMCEDPFGGYKARVLKDSLGHDTTGYPAIYNDPFRRMPLMLGFNVPTFKALDIFSAEVEYFPSMLPNDYSTVVNGLSPMPLIRKGLGTYNPDDYKAGAWRWSIYAKRTIVKGFSITGLAAFDHLRTTWWDGSAQTFSCMTKPGQWHWDCKVGYSF